MAQTTIPLTSSWNELERTSSDFESVIVEVEYALHDAPNVKAAHLIFDNFGETPLGYALELEDGTRSFFLAEENPVLSFGEDGSLLRVA